MRKLISLLIFSLLLQTVTAFSQNLLSDKENIVFEKNYYLLYLLNNHAQLKKDIHSSANTYSSILKNKLSLLEKEIGAEKYDAFKVAELFKFSEDETNAIEKLLLSKYNTDATFRSIIDKEIVATGKYKNDTLPLSNNQILSRAWRNDARGINHVIDVYGLGKKPNYPLIDSIDFDITKNSYKNFLSEVIFTVYNEVKNTSVFFEPSRSMAMRLLEVNGRYEAADYEPMEKTVNKAAFDLAKKINWNNYPYSFILVPGAGTENYRDSLNPAGILRCRIVAEEFKNKKAPFIIVSGGRVHPYKTAYSEAEEMKKYLMNEMKIPEANIIMEPHARHTTTNVRNANRLAMKYGIPLTKMALVSTVRSQSFYMTNDNFAKRCMNEIGHVPYTLGKRLSPTLFEYQPLSNAAIIDADEPLDP